MGGKAAIFSAETFRFFRELGRNNRKAWMDSNRERYRAHVALPRAMENAAWLARQARRLGKKYQSYWYSVQKGEWSKHDGWPIKPDNWKRLKGWIVRRKMKPAAATRASFPAEVSKIFKE